MKAYFFIILILLSACDEADKIVNPGSDYLIDKSVLASDTEQVFESGKDFKIVFPANAINQNIELKVKKETSAPTFSIENRKLGTNIYKLTFKGFQSFAKTVNIHLKYDPSKIESGKTPDESVKGMIYSNGTWKEANFDIDKMNSQIIFNINNLSSSNHKDEPILLADDEIIIGDGYTMTDEGQTDDLLAKLKYYVCNVDLGDFIAIKQSTNQEIHFEYPSISSTSSFESGPGNIDTVMIKWNGTKFNISREFKGDNDNIKLSITGDIDKKTWICNNLIYNYSNEIKISEKELKIVDIKIKLKPILSFYKDYWGQVSILNIDTYKTFDQGVFDHDLIKHTEEIIFTLTFTDDGNIQEIYTLKQLNDNPKLNKFSLSLRSNL